MSHWRLLERLGSQNVHNLDQFASADRHTTGLVDGVPGESYDLGLRPGYSQTQALRLLAQPIKKRREIAAKVANYTKYSLNIKTKLDFN